MSARDAILGRIRTALRDAPPASTPPRPQAVKDFGSPVARFAERVADFDVVVHRAAAQDVGETVTDLLLRRGASRVAVPAGFPSGWVPAGLEVEIDGPNLSAAALDAVDGVITGCALAIAETGSVILDTGPGQGRRALTLIPDYHLCVVAAGQIVPTVPDAVARLDPRKPLTWISGPSATSDIELDRVVGVHGPRTLEVVIAS